MTTVRRLALSLTVAVFAATIALGAEPKTKNVIFVTTDGLRWQEVFRGAEESLISEKAGGVKDVAPLRAEFWRETPEARREALMPFLWSTVANQGQIYGNDDKGSPAKVTNGLNFSYPGYNEMLTGAPDPKVDSNDKNYNANVSVFEWLNRKPEYQGKVAAVGAWDVYPYIFNLPRSGILMNSGWEPFKTDTPTPAQAMLNRLIRQAPHMWDDCRDDSLTFQVALEHLRRDTPRAYYIGLGDTDEHAHAGRYDHYLQSTHNADENLKILWDELQAHPQYRGTTTLIVSTDHGRGDAPRGWLSHGEEIKVSEKIWIAVIGPDTPALGERTNTALVTQSQIASTIAAALGEDFRSEFPKAAPPIADAIKVAVGPTPTAPGAPKVAANVPLTRIAFGSCATQERGQPIWDAVLATRPELMLMLGDNIYADTESMAVMRAKYAKLAAKPGFAALRTTVPILATWDDHDLGVNDGGSDYPMKAESQKEFHDFFGDPEDSPRRKQKGVYEAHAFGPPGKRVQVIMLDTRYFRSSPLLKKPDQVKNQGPYLPNPDPNATMLGEDQWRWLGEQLRVPAEIRLLVSSIQVVAEDHGWEKWANLPLQRDRLYHLIEETGAEGVIVLSGDRHLAELSVMDAGIGYPLYDLTSSGLNMASKAWRPQEVNRHRVATMNWGDNFGLVTIDWHEAGTRIGLQIRDVDGEIRIQEKVVLGTLKRRVTKPT